MAIPERIKVSHPVGGEIRTKQGMKDEVNINSIIKRWRDGVPLPLAHRDPAYGDFSSGLSFHESMNRVDSAREEFQRLPSEIRAECDHDLGVFLDKVNTDEGLKEMVDLGLDGYQTPPGVEVPEGTPKRNPEPEPEPEPEPVVPVEG